MEKATRRRLSAKAWPEMLARFEESGLAAAKGASVTRAAAGFIDLGALRGGGSRLELRLDLGAGMLLHLVRE